MMKWMMYVVLAVLVGGSWMMYSNKTKEMEALKKEIAVARGDGRPRRSRSRNWKSISARWRARKPSTASCSPSSSAGLVGIFFVRHLLPFFAQRVTHAVYDSAEMVEKDVMHDARSLMAQGDYEGAIAAFQAGRRRRSAQPPAMGGNRQDPEGQPGDPAAAIATIRHALESQAWEVNDAAYFLFRLAELYDEVEGDRASAVAIMNQVIEQFPETRHSANARNKLHEWEVGGCRGGGRGGAVPEAG